ncbi:solute carrier family 45 member 3 [Anguilla anguilla]|uniref:solute carrier family 45 member 3 n=1 Tax=Anguilla anguilla TaxID=7936 RepID=UPI0015A7CBAB|nr:solute carrier family 45 member 3 [Anguilla anguilla]XP_035244854.1 solute carrier family 45 member 3 [Anguilla anguilla]XP_035244855.1 solute carrier family 45 member 3 [Anguilla anguilla]XP_035244856.1 solute carrier family 45 member 3 [Anguilla anguilla]
MWTRVAQLFLVNALSCGLEICMSTGTIYIPPLLLEAGMEERFMTMVLGLGPVLGLVFVPMIGSASDRWSGRFGRRRPFIWALGAGVLLSLWLIPRASSLAALVAPRRRFLEVLLLVAGVSLIEFCGQACFTPLEALLSDLFPGEEESRRAFSVYALMVSLGGCVGYLLPAVDWNAGALADYAGGQEAFIYALLTLIFLLCMLSTAFISEERGGGDASRKRPAAAAAVGPPAACCLRPAPPHAKHLRLALGGCLSALPRLYRAYRQLPLVIWRLFLAEVCSWMALMTFLLFYTDFVGEGLYQGVPTAAPGSMERLRYDEGIRMGSLGLFLQCSTSVVFSLLMDRLVRSVGMRAVYLSSMAVLALATLVMSLSRSLPLVTVMAAATGYTFSTLQILPYTLTCLYHADMQAFFPRSNSQASEDLEIAERTLMLPPGGIKQHCSNGHPGGMPGLGSPASGLVAAPTLGLYVSLPLDVPLATPPRGLPSEPPRGMGLDLAILDSAYLLSQLLPSLLLGYVVQVTRSVATYMACASAFSLLAICISSRVIFDRADLERRGVGPARTQAPARKGFLDERT